MLKAGQRNNMCTPGPQQRRAFGGRVVLVPEGGRSASFVVMPKIAGSESRHPATFRAPAPGHKNTSIDRPTAGRRPAVFVLRRPLTLGPCPHPAFGHLLPEGEGLARTLALSLLGEGGRRPGEGELAANVHSCL